MDRDLKKTPLYDEHIRLGARMVGFAGWSMPIEYVGLKKEHAATRNSVGLFDVSHMGEFCVRGEKALETLQWLTTNDVSQLENNQAQYSLLTNPEGGIVDDLIVYCIEKNKDYLLCVNAANIEKDWDWISTHNKGAELINESDRWAQVAIQGPNSLNLLNDVLNPSTGESMGQLSPFCFTSIDFEGHKGILARTGYTGELGFEYFIEAQGASSLWKNLLEKGEKYQVQPVGLGARDTLRTEVKYSLYGQEIDDQTNPYEAGLGWVVKPQAKDFIGRSAVLSVKEKGLTRKLIGFKLVDKGIARSSSSVVDEQGEVLGAVTSGTFSPTLEEAIGMAYIPVQMSQEGTQFYIDIRGRKAKSLVVKTPFVKTKSR